MHVDWAAVEGELEVPLPADYKELYETFGGGVFCDSVYFLARDEGLSFDLLAQWRAALSTDQDDKLGNVSAVEPYAIYAPGGKVLVPWGSTECADEYCWLIDAGRPGECPVLARAEDGGTRTTCPPRSSSTAPSPMSISSRSGWLRAQSDLRTRLQQ
ncbi:SMI1/KNR4 family protein [Streptomyces sp. NPDC056121]|uniref:SMI1/KNR4 family protein n=1 Tax=Streptomyces sp. NPDC056121 TaxID=3345718 RepID=UPI0035DC72F9